MRTKTLILSGVLAALTSASVMAQVYSLNAVGYINVTCKPGFSIIADQLFANGAGVAQYLSGLPSNPNSTPGLLDAQLLDGQHNGVTTFKPSASGFTIAGVTSLGWVDDSGSAPNLTTLNPGEGIYIYNPFPTNFTLTFVGTVPQGATLTNTLAAGFNMVSSVVPQTGAIDTVLGLTPTAGDTLFFLSASGFDIVGYTTAGWLTDAGTRFANGTAPSPNVGEGFYYYNAAGATQVWNRSFTISN
jgi:hypothetical protein